MTIYRQLDEDFEREISHMSTKHIPHPEIELLTAGLSTIVLIDGRPVGGVLAIKPHEFKTEEVNPQITLTLLAKSITTRTVTRDEFKTLAEQ